MKKRITLFVVSLVTLTVGVGGAAFAASQPYNGACAVPGASKSSVCSVSGNDPLTGGGGTLSKVTNALSLVAGIVAVIFMIVGGIKYITSGGDSSAVSSAKSTILYAVIGLIVAALARMIIQFALSKV